MSTSRKITVVLTVLVIIFRVYSYIHADLMVRQRANDLTKIKLALESYHKDYGVYPDTNGKFRDECIPQNGILLPANEVIPGLVPKYLEAMPGEPQMDKTLGNMSLCYRYMSNGVDYATIDANFAANRETYKRYPELIDPARDGGPNNAIVDGEIYFAWKVYSPGGAKF